jgi:hypothetical protein
MVSPVSLTLRDFLGLRSEICFAAAHFRSVGALERVVFSGRILLKSTSVFRRVRAIAAESQDVFVELSLTGEPIGESIGGGGRTGQGVGLLADVVGHYNDSANMRERHALQTSMLLVDDAPERVRLCHSE